MPVQLYLSQPPVPDEQKRVPHLKALFDDLIADLRCLMHVYMFEYSTKEMGAERFA